MTRTRILRSLSFSLALLMTAAVAVPADAHVSKQNQREANVLPDFDEDDGLEQEETAFNAVYLDREGNVLGTFIDVPGARIRVYTGGSIEIETRDYTTGVDYYSDGQIRRIGNTRFRYSNSDRIRRIGETEFQYTRSGRFRQIGNVSFDYSSRGRLQQIENVDLDYDRDGILESIEDRETRNGVRIVVVN